MNDSSVAWTPCHLRASGALLRPKLQIQFRTQLTIPLNLTSPFVEGGGLEEAGGRAPAGSGSARRIREIGAPAAFATSLALSLHALLSQGDGLG